MTVLDEAMQTGRISSVSIEAGAHMARLAETAVAQVAAMGEPDERCSTCAFREGTIPNQCADTISDAMKCVVEREPFYCHDKSRPRAVCHGWYTAVVVTKDVPKVTAPWPFSHQESAS